MLNTQAGENELVGIGLYTVPEAARLTNVPRGSIRRWLLGHRYRRDGKLRELPRVLEGQVQQVNTIVGLGFLDLMEIRFVNAFRQHGVSLLTIRLAAERACEMFGQDHPFTRRRFETDGRRVFASAVEETGETKVIDLVKSQYAFHRVIRPSLYASLEFSELDDVLRWYPMWPKRQVVVDPQRSFGRPLVVNGHVPTEILAQAAKAENSIERVARWFDVPAESVRAAIKFEDQLAA